MGQNAYFYNSSNSGTYMACDTFNTAAAGYLVRRYVSPEFPKVFRIHGANGKARRNSLKFLKNATDSSFRTMRSNAATV